MRISRWHFAALGLIFGSRVFATTACISGATLASYIALNPTGCLVNDELVDGFAFTATLGPLTSSDITVTPTFTATSYTLQFLSSGFSVTNGNKAQYEIDFFWDPLVGGAGDDMDANSPTFPGTATVTTNICAGALFGSLTCPGSTGTNSVTVFDDGHPADNVISANTLFSSQVLQVGTQSFITLDATTGVGATSEIQGFDTSVFIVPEPGAMQLAAAGLIALTWRRVRRRGHPVL